MGGQRERDETITNDHPCWCCGYNLRGLILVGSCPECGEAIDITKLPRAGGWFKGLRSLLVILSCLAMILLAGGTLLLDYWFPVTVRPQYVLTVGAIAVAIALPVWCWTKSRILFITFAGLVLMLLILPFVSLSPVKSFVSLSKHIRNGMTQTQVIDRLDADFPNRISEGRPSIRTQRQDRLVLLLDPNDGRYNAETESLVVSGH